MASRTVQLMLTVRYESEDSPNTVPDQETCEGFMHDLVQFAANRGLLSGESEYVVESYRHTVETIATD